MQEMQEEETLKRGIQQDKLFQIEEIHHLEMHQSQQQETHIWLETVLRRLQRPMVET
jgi:hypothetical protein